MLWHFCAICPRSAEANVGRERNRIRSPREGFGYGEDWGDVGAKRNKV
jgi:hypothetical protein